MKITLISPYPDITSFGVRTLSAHLRRHGYNTQLIFLPDPFGDNLLYGVQRYEEKVLDQVVAFCGKSNLIGLTLMTNFYDGAVQITRKLKRALKAPIIWGGVHPTIRPEESLEHADMVCIGEGEDALLELMDKMSRGEDYTKTVNLWVKGDAGEVVKNPLSPLPQDLDVYPLPDYSMEDHYVMVDGRVVPLTHGILKTFLKKGTVSSYLGKTGYQTMTSRGCPYSCAYCINDTIKKMYGGKGKLRWRSVPHIMAELAWVRENMPYVDYIWISDDEFMARKMGDLEDFCRQYKEKIALPFSCLVSPLTVTEEKMELLVDSGLVYVQMGVESGSTAMQELFRRKNMNNSRMMHAIRIINKFKDRMYAPSYDFLIDVPYETDRDRIDSLRFISDIPKPFRLQPFTLILYPGTQLYDMAKQDGLIHDEFREIYNKTYTMRAPDYLNLLMTLSRNGKLPGSILKLLISPPVVDILNSKAMKPLIKLLFISMKSSYHHAKRVFGRS
jgi:radical SAM superfamily enzyme YgiQ (UPF0313 family)